MKQFMISTILALSLGLSAAAAPASGAEKAAPADSSVAVSGEETKTNKYEGKPMNPNTTIPSQTMTLDGRDWKIATDPDNKGRKEKWFAKAPAEVKPARVPGIIQEIFPCYHGVAWYWREFTPAANPHAGGRYLLRFWNVDYLADVWVNGVHVGQHEGACEPFVLDVTDAVKPGVANRLAVRVLNPTTEQIDGIRLQETAHTAKTMPWTAGRLGNWGGLCDSVEFIVAPAVRVEDVFVRADPKTGVIRVQANVRNAVKQAVVAQIACTVSPAVNGETLQTVRAERELSPGDTMLETTLKVDNPRLWELNDPHLYRVTVSVTTPGAATSSDCSIRCGFRDFRLEDGYFRLNGKRIFLKSSHSAFEMPVGMAVPLDPDFIRRDVLNCKAMGMNMIRSFNGLAPRRLLDFCDELGFLVYQENYSSWLMEDSPKMSERFQHALKAMVKRDRNHPSVVLWGVLNETPKGPLVDQAVASLKLIRELDDTRASLLNSGNWDGSEASYANPGADKWEGVLADQHPYQDLPHGAGVIHTLRTANAGKKPLFISEYGIGSAVDVARLTRHYEQIGNTTCEDAVFYRRVLDQFMADWNRWNLGDTFANPEDYFHQCLAWMAGLRKLGVNAIRSNPNVIGHSVTGTQDQGLTGEGLTATVFRELKPGVVDAMFDAFCPLRWCLFVEPMHVYRRQKVRLEAVLANEDALQPGDYPVRLQIVGPRGSLVFDRTITVNVPEPAGKPEPKFVLPVFNEEVPVDGPSGKYRLLATFEKGAAATGGDLEFYVADRAEMPAVPTEVVLWGDDPDMAKWLGANGIKTRPFASGQQAAREVILVGCRAAAGEAEAFRELTRHIARGSCAVFLSPEVFQKDKNPTHWLPLAQKGTRGDLPVWVYHKDDWAKNHPIFEGLPCGGIMDHTYYREIISKSAWMGQDVPAEVVAGMIDTSGGYHSGLSVAVYRLGEGRLTLNMLRIRENLGRDPVAERLLRNMLNYAARDIDKPLADLSVVASAVRSDRVILTFSEAVHQADAETTANYTIIPGVQVLAASLGTDRQTVTLTTSPLSEGEYTLKVKNIRDCERKPNMIAANTSKAFRYSPLFARWKLDEVKGLLAADAGGHKLDGVLKGVATWTNVAGRQAVMLDGASGIVETPTKLEHLTLPFTFTFWVNPAAEQMEYADIFGNHGGSGVGLVMQQEKGKTNVFGFGYGDGKQWQGPGTVQLTAGQWQHVAVVCDGSKAFFYVNGEVKSSGAAAGVFAPNPDLMFRLGRGFEQDGRFFRGLLSDVRIYRTALSPAEVQAVMKE